MQPDSAGSVPVAGRRVDTVFLLILLLALVLRLHLATTAPYIHDEQNTSIPLSKTISFAPGNLHLPLRGENHGALPAYVVKLSSTLFGTAPLSYRLVHVIFSMCTIVMVYLLARQWYGAGAARWAAALLAFNEYYLAVSARATAHVPHLFLVAAALFAFGRFLDGGRPIYLYATGACVGLAFYCKEHSALLLPLFLLVFLHPRQRQWLRSPHLYLSVATFMLVIGPDLFASLNRGSDGSVVTYGDQVARQATYSDHLKRIGGIGFSPYPSMFYARSAVSGLHLTITDRELRDETPEYPAMNPGLGALLIGGVLITSLHPGRDSLRGALLLIFWGVFGFFSLIKKGDPPGRLDPVSWIWVEATLIPAAVLAGARLADAAPRWRSAAWAFGGGVLLFALMTPTLQVTEGVIGGAQTANSAMRHTFQVAAADTVIAVRNHPLRTVGITLAVGIAVGSLVGFGGGWLARSRRQREQQTDQRKQGRSSGS